MNEGSTRNEHQPKRPYRAPRLRTFGAVRRLTTGGSLGAKEISKADSNTMP